MCFTFLSLIELFDYPDWNHAFVAKCTIKRIKDIIDLRIDIQKTLFLDFDDLIQEIFKKVSQIFINVHNIVLHMVDKLLHEGINITVVPLNEQSF